MDRDIEIAELKQRLAALEASPEPSSPPSPPPATPPKHESKVGAFVGLAVIAVALTFCVAAVKGSEPVKAVYRLEGDGFASITMSNADGGTEQRTVAMPWVSPVMEVPSGAHLYLSAQNEGHGEIKCIIEADGVVVNTASSYGQFTIAGCSAAAP